MTAMYPEYAQWLRQVRGSMKLPKAVKLLFDQGRLYMSPVTEAHSEADDSIRSQLAEQLGGESGRHVTRDKGVLPEMDGYTPEPDVLVVDAGVLGPADASSIRTTGSRRGTSTPRPCPFGSVRRSGAPSPGFR